MAQRAVIGRHKNRELKLTRGISFKDIIKAINEDEKVMIISHPNKKRYPNQKIYFVFMKNYIYAVPSVEEETYVFLKTVYPSHKYTKKYLNKKLKVKK